MGVFAPRKAMSMQATVHGAVTKISFVIKTAVKGVLLRMIKPVGLS